MGTAMQNRIAGLLLIFLFSGFLPSGPNVVSLVPECRSEGLPNPANAIDPDPERGWEQELLVLTNQQRIQQGLQALILDDELTRIAREHSNGMAQQGFISHDQPSGDLKTRMNRAGYLYEVARENVASARTVAKAHSALIESPAHKDNILAKDVTRVGIGIARFQPPLDKHLYITEVFADPRDEYQPAVVQTLLTSRVNELRQRGAGSMLRDPILEELASRSVRSLTLPYNRRDLQNVLRTSANELQESGKTEMSRLEVDVQLVHNPQNLSIPVPERDGQAKIYGSAVRQVMDSQNQTAFLVLTLIGITR